MKQHKPFELKNQRRTEYRNRLVSLMRSIPGSKLTYERRHMHHVWPDLVLRDKHGKYIASVCSTGSFVLNHWFSEAS